MSRTITSGYNTTVACAASTTILLIRHAATDAMDAMLCGRLAGVVLSREGRAQAAQLASDLKEVELRAAYSSPLPRALDTAGPLAAARRLAVGVMDSLDEVDFGEWTGQSFADLNGREAWRAYNAARATAWVPGGERPSHTAARIMSAIGAIAGRHPGEVVAVVTHAELVRYVVLHARGLSLDAWSTVDVPPASVTPVEVRSGRIRELTLGAVRRAAGSTATRVV